MKTSLYSIDTTGGNEAAADTFSRCAPPRSLTTKSIFRGSVGVRIGYLLALMVCMGGACSTKKETSPPDTGNGSVPAVESLLQGRWQSQNDPEDVFMIKGPVYTIYSGNGKKQLDRSFTYVADCGGVCTNRKSNYGCFTTAGEFDIDCQAIVTISNTELEVTQGNTGRTSRYKKNP